MAKYAVVLFNLGGPDSEEAVKPFLCNLFSDKAILSVPMPFRWLLAKIISSRRAPVAKQIYNQIGGKSPILEGTELQRNSLEKELNNRNKKEDYKVFIAMRYWKPFSQETVKKVKKYNPDEVILLPLYPQFSTTTTDSSIDNWKKKAQEYSLSCPTRIICCYPRQEEFIASHVSLLKDALEKLEQIQHKRVLFTAHGLPKKVIEKGDPYQWQVEQTAEEIIKRLDEEKIDWKVCYQSKVGPLEWIGPSTEEEIIRAAKEKTSLVVVPVAFVSEHSETLVELDIEYKNLAKKQGVPDYIRVPTLSAEKQFIASLATLCKKNTKGQEVISGESKRICPRNFHRCINRST